MCLCLWSVSQSCLIFLWLHGLKPDRLLCPWKFPEKNTGVGCHFLLQRIFPTQGSNLHLPCLLHFRWILYPLSHRGSPHCSCIKPAMWGVLLLHQAECSCCSRFRNQLWKFQIYYSDSIEENCRAYRRQICFCLLRTFFFFFPGNSILIFLGTHPFLSIWTFGTTFQALPCLEIGMWYKLSRLDSFWLANLNVERRDGREGKMTGASLTG